MSEKILVQKNVWFKNFWTKNISDLEKKLGFKKKFEKKKFEAKINFGSGKFFPKKLWVQKNDDPKKSFKKFGSKKFWV